MSRWKRRTESEWKNKDRLKGPGRDFKGPGQRELHHNTSSQERRMDTEKQTRRRWGERGTQKKTRFWIARVGEIKLVQIRDKKVTSRACKASAADGECASGGALRASGEKKIPGMNVNIYSTVYVRWQCLQVFMVYIYWAIVDVEQCSKPHCVRGGGEKGKRKGAEVTLRAGSFLEAGGKKAMLDKPLMITTWALAFLITHPGLTESYKALQPWEWSGADGTKTGQFLGKDALWTQQLMQPLLLQPVIIVVGEEEEDGAPKQGHHRWSHGPQAMWEELWWRAPLWRQHQTSTSSTDCNTY